MCRNEVLDLLAVLSDLLVFQPQCLGLTLHLRILAGQLLLKALAGFSEEGSGQRLRQPDLVIAVGAMQDRVVRSAGCFETHEFPIIVASRIQHDLCAIAISLGFMSTYAFSISTSPAGVFHRHVELARAASQRVTWIRTR
ncbi:hypothetical protein ACVWYH_010476 [Bradyrhizobium sp. GM24.11]